MQQTLQPRVELSRRRYRAASLLGTIRGKIFAAFVAMSLITAALGWFSYVSISQAGQLVVETFDKSLQAINYARAAAADFAAMDEAIARNRVATTVDPTVAERVTALLESLREDLQIAGERAQSARAMRAAEDAARAVAECAKLRDRLLDHTATAAEWDLFDRCAGQVNNQIDLMINITAGDGFLYRERALATIALQRRLDIAGAAAALLLAAIVTVLLARRIIGPVAAASAAAARIAAGELETAIPKGAADELGALLTAMAVMRDNIRAMVEREVAQRRSAQSLLADAIESSSEGLILVDRQDRIVRVNSEAASLFGSLPAQLRQGEPFAGLVRRLVEEGVLVAGPEERATLSARLTSALPAPAEAKLADGRWLRISRSFMREGGFLVICSDITEIRLREAELEQTNLQLDAALSNMSQGLCQYDGRRELRVVNARFRDMFDLPPGTLQLGASHAAVLDLSLAAGAASAERRAEIREEQEAIVSRREKGVGFQELPDGRVVAITHEPIRDGGWVATYEDITDRRRAEAQILFMARHDALTSLPNRVLFGERMEQALSQVGRQQQMFAVLCLDLDHFKAVNDTLGHLVGDRLLQQVAERLQACAREVDTVARLGGDEFAIVQVGLERPEDAGLLARRIVGVIGEPYDIDNHRIVIGISAGIAVAPNDGTSGEALLKNADLALYRAKAEGRNTSCFFESEMDARLQARRRLELDLRRALTEGQFYLTYQPLVELATDRVGGFEALLRWRHPQQGVISPAEFIPIAEEVGLIVPIGEWVMRQACLEAMSWPEHVKVAVNVSPAQFRSMRLVECTVDALSSSGLAANRLELEITESVLLHNNDWVLDTLHQIRDLGVHISMDDFGTGYSSLSYLRSFPFDKIKIDQSFIRDLPTKADSLAIVRAIIGLGASLGMRVTAEGVETPEQMAGLRAARCDQVQGYLLSRPCNAADIPDLLVRLDGRNRSVG